MTNGEVIRNMSDEELAKLFLFFVPTNFDRAMYTGISGKYTSTVEETFDNNLEWLKQPVDEQGKMLTIRKISNKRYSECVFEFDNSDVKEKEQK